MNSVMNRTLLVEKGYKERLKKSKKKIVLVEKKKQLNKTSQHTYNRKNERR